MSKMTAYIMSAGTKEYLCFGENAVQAAQLIPAPQDQISVHHSIPCEIPAAYEIDTSLGGILLKDAHGNSLGGEPYSRFLRDSLKTGHGHQD